MYKRLENTPKRFIIFQRFDDDDDDDQQVFSIIYG